jgi:16S rRNA G1207 methylase RsmC
VHPDEVATDTAIELLWSNPPIRIGKGQLRELLTLWLSRLSPTGHAHLVVSKNLGADSLSDWLNDTGFATRKLSSSKGFRVLEVKKN